MAMTHSERMDHIFGSLFAPTSTSATTKEHVKDVHGVVHIPCPFLQPLLTMLVIHFSLLLVTQNLICGCNLLKLHTCTHNVNQAQQLTTPRMCVTCTFEEQV